ncbi:MAG: ectoine hydroxylase [Rhodospirillaceae bacterium]|nr:ectoine hydroxylase [Rhodospirillaceae bacterium]
MPDLYPSRCDEVPRVIERSDPVVYSSLTSSAPLTAGQIHQYSQDGYVVLRGLFSPSAIKGLRAEAVKLLDNPASLDKETLVTESGSGRVRSIFMVHRQSAAMARLAGNEWLTSIARFLLADDVYVHQSRLNYKPGFVGKEFYWHSDFETWHVEDGMPRMRALSMSILLEPNTPFNGPLMIIPGSHRSFITCVGRTPENHYLTSLKKQEYGTPDQDSIAQLAAQNGIAALTGNAGDVIIFDCNAMHGSNSNITPFPRANAFIVYNAISNRLQSPFGAQTPRPEFIATRELVYAVN